MRLCTVPMGMPRISDISLYEYPMAYMTTGRMQTLRFEARRTASTICNGSAVSSVYQQGAELGNPEFLQIHPTAIPGSDKNRLMSEACRGEGGRKTTEEVSRLVKEALA